jgi:hypothetical protein
MGKIIKSEEELKQFLDTLNSGKEETLQAHYGISNERSIQLTKQLVMDFFDFVHYHEILDKQFPKLSAEDRFKVAVFSDIARRYKRFME